jgi:hypothetical protein
MFRMLEVVFRRDPVAAKRFGARQFQITLIISLGVLRLRAAEAGRFSCSEPGILWHCVGHIVHLLARLCRAGLIKLGSGFHNNPYVTAAKAVRCSVGGLSVRQNLRRIALTAAIEVDGSAGTSTSRDKRCADSDRQS